MLIGYARISTEEQNLALQLDALEAAGCEKVFRDDGVSGGTTDRGALNDALGALTSGDVLVVWKLDRLGRSLAHLMQIISRLEADAVGFRSLSEAIDTTTACGRLLFHVVGAIAEFERRLISERTIAGMAAARARGQHLGRERKMTEADIAWAYDAIASGTMTPRAAAASMRISISTLYRALRRSGDAHVGAVDTGDFAP
jgi:DNA invertase Pin-like site-specific DNA recombinase